MTKRKKEQRRRKVTAFLLALCMVWLMLPPGEARAATPQPEAEVQQTYVDDSTDINAIPAYQPEGDSKVLNYVHSEVFAKGDHIARLKQDETLSSYAFLNRDGTKTVYYLDEAVKFTAADGTVLEKDITLTEALKGYETVQNDIGLHISQNPAAGIQISYNNKQISLLPSGGKSTGKLSGNTVRYENYYGEDTALVYTPTLSGVKEEIILSSYTGQNEFVFYINTGGLMMYPQGDRYYLAEGKGTTEKIWLGQIEVFDSNLKPCKGSMTAETVAEGQRYKLTVTVDEDYLTASDTCYPVTVDPTLSVSDNTHGANAIQDAPIYEGYPTSNFGSYQYNRAGYADATLKRGRTAVKLTGLLNHEDYIDSTAADITSAQFYMADASGTSGVYVFIRALSSNASWTENNVTWNNVGSTASTVYGNIALPAGGFGCFDITQLVKAWKNGSYSGGQCGFVMIGSSESTKDKALYSSEHTTTAMRPYVTVTYSATTHTVSLSNTAISVNEGTTKQLTATTSPTGLPVYWETEDPSIATVSSTGVVTGVKAGQTTITASVNGGNPVVCSVYVVKPTGVYYIKNFASNYLLDGGGANISQENLKNIRQRAKISTGPDKYAQMWRIAYLGSGMYSIRPMHKRNLALTQDGSTNTVKLQDIGLLDSISSVPTGAKWYIRYEQNGYVIYQGSTGRPSLYPIGGALWQDSTVGVFNYADATAFRWTIEPVNNMPEQILLYDMRTGTCVDTPTVHVKPEETRSLMNAGIDAELVTASSTRNLQYTSLQPSKVAANSSTGALTGITSMSTVVVTVSGPNSSASAVSFLVVCSPYRINLDVCYDEAYLERYPNAVTRIQNYLETLHDDYYEVFAIFIEYTKPSLFTSLADTCVTSGCTPNKDTLCTAGSCENSSYNSNTDTFNHSNGHHKNIYNVLYRLPTVDITTSVKLAFIGHNVCIWAKNWAGSYVEQTGFTGINLMNENFAVSGVFNFNSNKEFQTLTHEFGHFFLVIDHYDRAYGTDGENEKNLSDDCIYGYNHSEDYIDNMTICDGCRAVIQANAGRYSS